MSLKDKLLRSAITFLEKYYSCRDIKVTFDTGGKKTYPLTESLGELKIIPHLTCLHPESLTELIIEVVPTLEDVENPAFHQRWKDLMESITDEKVSFLTYKNFGKEEGRTILGKKLKETIGLDNYIEVEFLTYHRGKVNGDLGLDE